MNAYKVIKIEDTHESVMNALTELHNALMKGNGIGFDLKGLKYTGEALEVFNGKFNIDFEELKKIIDKSN